MKVCNFIREVIKDSGKESKERQMRTERTFDSSNAKLDDKSRKRPSKCIIQAS